MKRITVMFTAVALSAFTLSSHGLITEYAYNGFDELITLLRECLSSLPPKAQALLGAFYKDGQSLKQMASRFRRKTTTLAVTLSRVRKSVRNCLEGKGVQA